MTLMTGEAGGCGAEGSGMADAALINPKLAMIAVAMSGFI
jgi:hypothetical protein